MKTNACIVKWGATIAVLGAVASFTGCSWPGADAEGETAAAAAAVSQAPGHGPRAVRAAAFAETNDLDFGVAGDDRVVFVTEPLARQVLVLDRASGRTITMLPPPPAGFLLPFTVRVPSPGHLVLLDPGGFPSPTVPSIARVYDYEYRVRGGDEDGHGDGRVGRFEAQLVRTVSFEGLPVVFAEDVEVTAEGLYVVSESVIGALWVIGRAGAISPGIFPASPAPADAIPAVGPCLIPTATVGGLPFFTAGNFGPGALALASRDHWLYFSSTCRGGVQRVPIASLTDPTRTPDQRAADIQVVSPRPAGAVETFEGLAFNRFDAGDDNLYASDSFRLQIIRIDVRTGARTVLASDPRLFNFPTEMQFLPPVSGHDRASLFVANDQEYRLAAINAGIPSDMLQLPFFVTEVRLDH